ncbi:MAG: peptidase S46 [Sneathiella sp.]|nr:MAG: peptidase S46 [Sneathiella sp.]
MSNNHLPLIAKAVQRPLLLHPTKAEWILHALSGRIGFDTPEPAGPDASRFRGDWRDGIDQHGASASYAVENGAAIIPVTASLVNRGAWVGENSGLQSYEGIEYQLKHAMSNDKVERIVFDIDSPGGEAGGMWGISEAIRASGKPTVALVNDMACSAAYGIASACDQIICSPTSVVGSIGVILVHMDWSKNLAEEGITPTIIHAGARKADGNPYEPLPEAVREDLQTEVDRYYERFVETVAAGRSGITPEQIRATEARCYIGQDAVAAGLADAIGTLDSVLYPESQTQTPQGRGNSKGKAMSGDNPTLAAVAGITETQINAAVDAARIEGATAERERIKSILACDAASGRIETAQALAFTPGMTAETATETLETVPLPDANTGASVMGMSVIETDADKPKPSGGTTLKNPNYYLNKRRDAVAVQQGV